ncbi:transposase [Vibrio mimicus]
MTWWLSTALIMLRLFSMPLRTLHRFFNSIFMLEHVPFQSPHYPFISRCAKQIEISFKFQARGVIQHLAVDTYASNNDATIKTLNKLAVQAMDEICLAV